MANGEAAAALDLNEAEEEKPTENEELVRGPAILLTTGFRGDKEMFVIVQTNKLSIYKDELHFTVKPVWVIWKIGLNNEWWMQSVWPEWASF